MHAKEVLLTAVAITIVKTIYEETDAEGFEKILATLSTFVFYSFMMLVL